MHTLQDYEYLVKDENGEPYGQGYAFTVGSNFSEPFIVNLATLADGKILVFVAQPPEFENLLYDSIVHTFEEGVQASLTFLAEHASDILEISEPLL